MQAQDCLYAAEMPDIESLKKAYKMQANVKQRQIIRHLSKNEDRIEGMLGVGSVKNKLNDRLEKTEV